MKLINPMKKIIIAVMVLCFSQQLFSQGKEEVKKHKIGVILKASTTGIGGDIGYRINSRWLIKAGIDQFNYDFNTSFEQSSSNFDLKGSVKAGTIGLLADYQVAYRFYVTGGLVLNNFKTDFGGRLLDDIEFGDVIISKEKVGDINWKIKPKSSIAPYLGIGFGNLLNQKRKLNLGFEMGAMLQGPPDFDITANGFFEANSSPEFNQAGTLNNNFSSFQFYPVIRLHLAYAIKKF